MRLDNVNLTPTMRCNLKCALCGVLVPQYEYRPHMTVEEFSQTLQALFSVVDHVGRMQITGGEPLLHPDLAAMLAECFRNRERFDELWLFSNCAVPFRRDVVEILGAYKERVTVHCSDYGVRPEVSAQNLRLLEEAGIPCKYLKYYGEDQYCDGWVDNGDFVPRHRPQAENEAVFAACAHVCRGGSWYIRHGQMHWCGRSLRGTELGKIPLRQEDYVDLLNQEMTVEEKRRQLEALMHVRSITACDYCGGLYGTENAAERRPAGEQLEC